MLGINLYITITIPAWFITCKDKIPPKLLQVSAIVIARPILTHIFNQSINTGIFPNDLKTAISPLYKSGSNTECSNCRPISVLSTVAKIFEKLISVQLYEYLENNAILASQQSGFRKKFSTGKQQCWM